MKLFTRYFYIFLFLIIAACNGGPKEEESQIKSEKEIQIQVPDFNADSAYAYIEKQLSFGPRVPNTPAHHSCALYLENKLREYTPDVIVQVFKARAFDGSILNGQNIIASFNKENQHRILLASHWDSRPFADHDPDPKNHRKPIDGANDGASGVGILIEIARQLTTLKVNTGVDIILFDLEDYGEPEDQRSNNEDNWGLGSQYWSRNKHQVNYMPTFGILLDMVGASNATFTKEGYSMEYASDFVNKIWDVAAKIKENPTWNSIPIVFLTAKGDTMSVGMGNLASEDYIVKPFDVINLKERVEKVIGK